VSALRLETDPTPSVRLAPAKVNLGLAVGNRHPGGHHELRTVMVRLDLADRLVAATGQGAVDHLEVSGDPDCPTDGNLVLRAVAALRGAFEPTPQGTASDSPYEPGAAARTLATGDLAPLDLRLDKRIPMAAGLGGGSSDAAAALSLAAHCWRITPPPGLLSEVALRIGADVPFFMAQADAAIVSGIGEEVQALPGVRGGAGFLLITPPVRASTAAVFAAHDTAVGDAPARHSADAVEGLAAAFERGLDGAGLAAMADGLRDANDLWPALVSVWPALVELRRGAEQALGRPVLLSGSGSTLFAVYPSREEAEAGRRALAPAMAGSAAVRLTVAGTPATGRL
jgi:4-diphosphocytidyl-2-C-methyl-D-erythritol kinase